MFHANKSPKSNENMFLKGRLVLCSNHFLFSCFTFLILVWTMTQFSFSCLHFFHTGFLLKVPGTEKENCEPNEGGAGEAGGSR